MEIASVYEQALKYKKDRHPSDKSLSNPCGCGWLWWAARVEPLAQFEWFSVRMVFVSQSASILKLLSRRILSLSWWWYIVPMMWVQNIWTSVNRKRDRQKYILGCGQITMLDSNLGFTPFYLRALNHMCNKYLFCGKFGHHQNISSFVHSPIFKGLWAKMWF